MSLRTDVSSGSDSCAARVTEWRRMLDNVRSLSPSAPGVNSSIRIGQYAVVAAFLSTPSSRMSETTPTTSRQVPFVYGRMNLPMAADGFPQSSRARFSETIATCRI